jgi:hypothetical protein
MIVDLTDKEEKGRFDLKDGGWIELRLLSVQDIKDMRDACIKTVAEYPLLDGKYQRFERMDFNSDLWDEMRYDRTIVGWGDIFDKNEKPIPCTKEMKVALMIKVPEFITAYTEGMKTLKDAEKAKAEVQEKN